MYLYICEGYEKGPERHKKTDFLVKKAAALFMKEKNIESEGLSIEIIRGEYGKPGFAELPLSFSVSHTADLWSCLMTEGDESVGVDIQVLRDVRQDRIMDRYFTEDEKKYVNQAGKDSFFMIWTRKEAYAKFTGRGLNRALSEVSTLNNKDVVFIDFDIREDVKGSCCVKQKGELCIQMI